MSFYSVIDRYRDLDLNEYFEAVTLDDVRRSINATSLTHEDLLNLLSPKALELLEEMAIRANEITLRNFGRSVLLYTPMYLANYCVNNCAYCGYSVINKISRKRLNLEEIEREGRKISKDGFKHLLILTGESKFHTPVNYIKEAIGILKEYFSSLSIEIFALSEEEYREVVEAGVDGLTIYQETYDEVVYDKVHISGPKKDFKFRLDAPERGAKAGMRTIGIGALLGLSDFRRDAFLTALHGEYITKKYKGVDIAYALPRIRPCEGEFNDINKVNDRNFVQMLLAFRIFNPMAGINISTREHEGFREKLIPLGVTRLSAGVSTKVGGHTLELDAGSSQFEIDDTRSVNEIKDILYSIGYQPIFKDWERI